MEHNHGGLVQIIFLSFYGWFVGSMLIFQGVRLRASQEIARAGYWFTCFFFPPADSSKLSFFWGHTISWKWQQRIQMLCLYSHFKYEICRFMFNCWRNRSDMTCIMSNNIYIIKFLLTSTSVYKYRNLQNIIIRYSCFLLFKTLVTSSSKKN